MELGCSGLAYGRAALKGQDMLLFIVLICCACAAIAIVVQKIVEYMPK